MTTYYDALIRHLGHAGIYMEHFPKGVGGTTNRMVLVCKCGGVITSFSQQDGDMPFVLKEKL